MVAHKQSKSLSDPASDSSNSDCAYVGPPETSSQCSPMHAYSMRPLNLVGITYGCKFAALGWNPVHKYLQANFIEHSGAFFSINMDRICMLNGSNPNHTCLGVNSSEIQF